MSDSTTGPKRNRLERDRLRLRVQAQGDAILDDLIEIQATAKEMKETKEEGERWTRPSLEAMKLRADIDLALLKKILPDLKAMEISGDPEDPLAVRVVNYAECR